MTAAPPAAEDVRPRVKPRDGTLALTVITPSLNHGRLIGPAIDSACPRADIAFEHLVIDGGSTDETGAELARRPWLDVHVRPELDSHEAMNYALGLARGEIIGFLNADDRYDPGALDTVVDHFVAHPNTLVLCGGMRIFVVEDGVERDVAVFYHTAPAEMQLELTFGNPGFNSWFFRCALLRRLGPFRVQYRIAADRDMLLRVVAATQPRVLERIVYHYRKHEGSRTMDPRGTNRQAMIMDHIRLVREQATEVWAHDPDMLALLARWDALERFKLFVRAVRYGTAPIWASLAATPWRHVPAALKLRRKWLRILAAHGRSAVDYCARPSKVV